MTLAKKQGLLKVLLIFVLVFAVAFPAYAADSSWLIPDLNPDYVSNFWAYEECQLLYDLDIIMGYEGFYFRPYNKISRAEFIVCMDRAFELPSATQGTVVPFKDFKGNAWYADAVQKAYAAGILEGFGNYLKPSEPITRGEMAKIIYLTIKDNVPPVDKTTSSFKDVAPNNPYATYIEKISALGIMNGYPDHTFGINKPTNRAEASVVLYRAMMAETKEDVLPTEDDLRPAAEGYANGWVSSFVKSDPEKVPAAIEKYALPSVIAWRVDSVNPDIKEEMAVAYGKLIPGTLKMEILERSRTLAKVKVTYEISIGVLVDPKVPKPDVNGIEEEVGCHRITEIYTMKLTNGQWKVGQVTREEDVLIRERNLRDVYFNK